MLWYIKHCNYEKLKPTLIKAGMSHIRNESADEIAYAQDMFETIFKDFQQAKDVHITGLLADLMNRLTEDYSEKRKQHLVDIFTACSRYEAAFWDMAWEMRQ